METKSSLNAILPWFLLGSLSLYYPTISGSVTHGDLPALGVALLEGIIGLNLILAVIVFIVLVLVVYSLCCISPKFRTLSALYRVCRGWAIALVLYSAFSFYVFLNESSLA